MDEIRKMRIPRTLGVLVKMQSNELLGFEWFSGDGMDAMLFDPRHDGFQIKDDAVDRADGMLEWLERECARIERQSLIGVRVRGSLRFRSTEIRGPFRRGYLMCVCV